MPPVNGTVDTPDHTREGASVDYRCDKGFRPSTNFSSICESTGYWTPPPQGHNCTFVTGLAFSNVCIINSLSYCACILFPALVTLTPLPRIVSREDIECPMDIIPYICSIESISENVQLRWLVTFPGLDPITILYFNSSNLNIENRLDMNVVTTLTQFKRDEFIESELNLTVLFNVSMNGTLLECRSENLNNEVDTVYVNTSG